MNKVAIIVLNWNGIIDTLDCLDSLQQQTHKDFSILVVDNGSNDNSKSELDKYKAAHKNTEIIYNHKNLGFAGGVNTGIKWAIDKGFEFIALINNDATVDKSWIENLLSGIKNKDTGICTGLLLHQDGKTIDSTGDWYSTWGLPFPRNRNDVTSKSPDSQLVFSASGGASLYKTALFRDIGLFDEDFFAYYEDTDISFRAQLAGWNVAYTKDAIAYHKQGETSKKIPGFTTYQTFKNLPLLFIKNVPYGLLLSIGVRFYFAYSLMLGNSIVKGSGKSAISGAWMGFTLGFRALSKRRNIQKYKRVDAKYINSILWRDLPPDQTGIRKLRKIFTDK
jgi:hypothetical protein